MPIYEYKCQKCGKNFEYLVIGSKGPIDCPKCKSEQIKKRLSSCGFLTKGNGGETIKSSASAASACGSCSATSCSTCGH
ncbi:MAG: zinc ribbon domain-containing protein [Deltaproteobacteria bacterium]|nr:zinc ribbon domain-containing protein [Deltaproteobacteria bacterium]